MKYKKRNVRWMLVVYDLLVYELSAVLLLGLYGGNDKLSISGMLQQIWNLLAIDADVSKRFRYASTMSMSVAFVVLRPLLTKRKDG